VVTIGAPADPAHVLSASAMRSRRSAPTGRRRSRSPDGASPSGGSFVDEVQGRASPRRSARCAARCSSCTRRATPRSGIDNATAIFLAAKHPKSFVTLDAADHLLTRPEDAEYAADVIAAWASRYLDPAPPPAADGAPEGVVRVSEADPAGFLQDVTAGARPRAARRRARRGRHGLGAPRPTVPLGRPRRLHLDDDPHVRPPQGLAARPCLGRRDPRQGSTPQDCADCETREGRIDRFTRVITLEGDLDDAQRARLLEIADRCPVHRTLERRAEIETRLLD
jgi:hypothetical protein